MVPKEDIVERLLNAYKLDHKLYDEAAETILQLRAEIARMKQERDYEC